MTGTLDLDFWPSKKWRNTVKKLKHILVWSQRWLALIFWNCKGCLGSIDGEKKGSKTTKKHFHFNFERVKSDRIMSKIWNKSWFEVDSLGLTRRKSRWSWSFRLKRVSEVNPSRSQKNKKWNFWDRAGGPRNHCTSDLTKSRHTGNVQPNVA